MHATSTLDENDQKRAFASVRVLVVDDREDGRSSVSAALACEGFPHPAVADSGAAALRLLEQTRFDLVITDLEMPQMSGVDLIRRVRARWSTPVILMSANPIEIVVARCGDARPDGILQKPIDLDVLVSEIQRCLAAPGGVPRGTIAES